MHLEYVPLLQRQRELLGLPRDMQRFRQYLRTLSADGAMLDCPPLVMMNPMAKDHVAALLDALLALDADRIAAQALREVAGKVATDAGDVKVALVVADDLLGGWTNRYDYEYTIRFGLGRSAARAALPKWLKHLWLAGVLWSSEAASERAVRDAVLTVVLRAAHVQRHGAARTLDEMLAQEGHVLREAGCSGPCMDEEEIAYTRFVIAPFLQAEDMRTCIECLFGDPAGRTLGFTPRGLSLNAGLALALHDARQTQRVARTMRA